jgi:ABC-2 type transport system permease protein
VISTLMRVSWISLGRDRVAQAMTFLLPILFFTIFAAVFGGQGNGATGRIEVALVNEDTSAYGARLATALAAEPGLRALSHVTRGGKATDTLLTRARAEAMVRAGAVPVAVILPPGLTVTFGMGGGPPIELLSDPSDPVAPQVVAGLVQKTAMTAAPEVMIGSGIEVFEHYAGAMTPRQREAVAEWTAEMRAATARRDSSRAAGGAPAGPSTPEDGAAASMDGPVAIRIVDVLGDKRDNPIIAFYAAGIAIMFLLFTSSGAAGALLEEMDSGTLERVLTTRAGMTGLLAAKAGYMVLLGVLQITVMFVYGALVFRLPLFTHLPGFAVMTLVSAAAVAAFGLLLATACRTRAQLSGFSTITILVMSAIGGSMFPRFLMSEGMQKFGLVTFNTWALDGFVKVFWRDARLVELWPQVLVLLGFTAAFLVASRLLARRWETA